MSAQGQLQVVDEGSRPRGASPAVCLIGLAASLPESLEGDLAREVIRAERLGALAQAPSGPPHRLVLTWLPENAPAALLAEIVAWRDLAPGPAALLGVAPSGDAGDSERALAAGFDDFVAGRASARELAGRLRALARRLDRAAAQPAGRICHGPIVIDRDRHQLWVGSRRVTITRTELAVLTALVAGRGRIMSREEILDAAWGEDGLEVGERAVDNVILRLRRKLGAGTILTVRGVGFRLIDP